MRISGGSGAEFPDPGPVALLGSGETSRVGGRVFEKLAGRPGSSASLRIAILETPAGFEPNSDRVAGRIADFLRRRLENLRPLIEIIPARQRDSPFSPDDPGLLQGLLRADLTLPRGLRLPGSTKTLLFTNRIIWTTTASLAQRRSPVTVADNSKLFSLNTSGDYEIAKNLRMTLNGSAQRLWHKFLKEEDFIAYAFGTTLTFQF